MPRDPNFTGPGAGRPGHWCVFLKTTQVNLRSSYVENQDLFFSVPSPPLITLSDSVITAQCWPLYHQTPDSLP